MLSFPRRFLFGDQSKLDFKFDQVNGFARLYSERHIPYHDSRYWSAFLQFDGPSDIFSLLSLSDVRKARTNAPENLITLVRVLVAHLESLLIDPKFSPPPESASSAANGGQGGSASSYLVSGLSSFGSWRLPGFQAVETGTNDERDRTREALNVVRILTRTLPAVLEHGDSTFEAQVLWGEAPAAYGDSTATAASATEETSPANAGDTSEAQFVIDDEDQDDEGEGEGKKGKDANGSQSPEDPLQASAAASEVKTQDQHKDEAGADPMALGERLIRIVIDLLFCSGFTIPWTDEQLIDASTTRAPHKVHYAIWEAGVGSSVDLAGTTRQHVSNRVEVLRLLLVLLSKSIYVPAEKQTTFVDQALRFTVQDLERHVLLPLMCSLLNTSIGNARDSASAWLGLSSVGGLVGAGSNSDEVRNSLVAQSLQVLDVLLNYEPPQPRETDAASLSTLGPPQPGPSGKNVFRFYLSKLHRQADFDFIWNGMSKSLNEHITSPIQILAIQIPTGAGRRNAGTNWHLSQVAERLMLLWRLLELNAKFRTYLLDSAQRAPALLSFLLYFSLTYKDNLALQGLVRLCAFMLQDISSERSFAINIAKPGSSSRISLPPRLGVVGGATATDALIQGVYVLTATTKGQLSSLYPPLILALSNTAPCWRSVSITSSTRLIALLRSFSQPAFLLSDENNPRLLYYVLEAINSVLVCQYNANPNLVYAFVLAHKVVASLERFSLRRGVEEVWKKRRALGTDTRDWFENVQRLEKVPFPPSPPSAPSESPMTSASVAGTAAEAPAGSNEAQGENERAPYTAIEKGKMRRISTSSNSAAGDWDSELAKYPDDAVEEVARKYIGKNGFRPTQSWVESWLSGLPLHTLRLAIDRLLPEVERIASGGVAPAAPSHGNGNGNGGDATSPPPTPAAGSGGGNVDEKLLAYLREQDLSALLPAAPGSETDKAASAGIHSRPWNWTPHASIWLKSYLWGTIYVSSLLPFGIWADTHIRLFRIHERADPTAVAPVPRTSTASSQPPTPGTAPAPAPAPSSSPSTPTSTPLDVVSQGVASLWNGKATEGLSEQTRSDLGITGGGTNAGRAVEQSEGETAVQNDGTK